MSNKKSKGLVPILIVDNLSSDFGSNKGHSSKKEPEITENEKVLLTLIAQVIVDIIIKKEL